MQTRSHKFLNYVRSRPVAPCAQCGKMLFAPEWSEYIDRRRARHLWTCTACDYDFETLVVFPAEAGQRGDEAA